MRGKQQRMQHGSSKAQARRQPLRQKNLVAASVNGLTWSLRDVFSQMSYGNVFIAIGGMVGKGTLLALGRTGATVGEYRHA